MKVIGQSILVEAKPYLHLGYVSTTTLKPDNTFGAVSILLAVGAMVFLVVSGVFKLRKDPLNEDRTTNVVLGVLFLPAAVMSGWLAARWAMFTIPCILLGLGAVVFMTPGRLIHRLQSLSRSPGLVCTGILLLVLAVASGVLAFYRGEQVYDYPETITRLHAMRWVNALATGEPTDQRHVESTIDAWKHPMRLSSRMVNGRKIFIVTSAGPDGVFGTADDIVIEEKERTNPATQSDEATGAEP